MRTHWETFNSLAAQGFAPFSGTKPIEESGTISMIRPKGLLHLHQDKTYDPPVTISMIRPTSTA